MHSHSIGTYLTARELVRHLGGPAVVARVLKIGPEAVSMWSVKGGIPPKHHLALWRLAVARGVAWQPPGSEGWRLVRDEAGAAASADDGAAAMFAQCSHNAPAMPPVREAA